MWQYQTEEGSHDMFMDIDEDIRFRVTEEIFIDTSPTEGGVVAEKAAVVADGVAHCD